MGAEAADRLRALARDHAEGRLTLSAYRRLRAPVLDGLVGLAVEPSPETTQPRGSPSHLAWRQEPTPQPSPALQSSAPRQPSAVRPSSAPPPSPVPQPRPRPGPVRQTGGRGRNIAVIVAILASIAVLLVWRHATQRRPLSAGTSIGSGSAGESADALRALLQPFIDNPDWSDARLIALNGALLEAGRSRIAAAQSVDWFNAFVDQVRGRLKEQQALAGAPVTPGKSPLAALAVTLGIDLTSPDRPIRIADARSGAIDGTEHPSASSAPASTSTSTSTSSARERMSAVPGTRASTVPASTARAAREAREVPDAAGTAGSGASDGESGSAAAMRVPGAELAHPQSVAAHAPNAATHTASAAPSVAAHPPGASAVSGAVQCSAGLAHTRHTYCQDALSNGALGPLLAVIPPGSFQMGDGEVPSERPVHRVTIAHPFAMSVYEVSQGEFRQYCRATGRACPSQPWAADDYPVVEVSWNDARDYARWLSQATGQIYRLPTEAEWEYAARAGRTGLYPSGDSLSPTDAYFSMAETLTAPARRSQPFNANAWRLLHMVGNVREWVQDTWSPSFSGAPSDGSAWQDGRGDIKVVRGGCYADRALDLRLTTRGPLSADARDRLTGIRIVREIR